MPNFTVTIEHDNDVEDFPILASKATFSLTLDIEGDVPEAALRAWAADAIAVLATDVHPDDLTIESSTVSGRKVATSISSGITGDLWTQPAGVNLRSCKTAHRLVQEVAKHKKGAYTGELVEAGFLSAPTMSRFLNVSTSSGAYLHKFVDQTRDGRRKILKVNDTGKVLLDLIKKGSAPVS